MINLMFILLLTASLPSALAFSKGDEYLDLFIASYLTDNELFSIEDFKLTRNYSVYYFVVINGTQNLIVKKIIDSPSSFVIVQNESEIRDVLFEYYILKGFKKIPPNETQKLKEFIISFSKSREPGESRCKKYLGTDLYPCSDRESCFKSCFTPICSPLAQGVGWEFIDLIVYFENRTKNLEYLTRDAEMIIERFSENQSKENFLAVKSILLEINRVATNITTNGIFSVYQICHPVNYDIVSLIKAKRLIEKFEIESLPIIEVDEHVEKIAEEAKRRSRTFNLSKSYKETNEKMEQVSLPAQETNRTMMSNNQNNSEREQGSEKIMPADVESRDFRIPLISDLIDLIISLF
ncbi:MAG: hypothetical protein QXW70_04185 [Candidatus Anstonellales archaeon]